MIDTKLDGMFVIGIPQGAQRMYEAMRYSLLSGGKRIRPMLTLEFCRLCGGTPEQALDAACAIEMLHCYSLIHDDMPCMDNDDFRRGKPSNHKVYGEAAALLAGDALQSAAFSAILESETMEPVIRAECARILAAASGPKGMCAGQAMDLLTATVSFADLERMFIHKTGKLIVAAAEMGVVVSSCTSAEKRSAAVEYASRIGLAFQIRDDLLDMEDEPSGLLAFISADDAEKMIISLTDESKRILQMAFDDESAFLCRLADDLALRIT